MKNEGLVEGMNVKIKLCLFTCLKIPPQVRSQEGWHHRSGKFGTALELPITFPEHPEKGCSPQKREYSAKRIIDGDHGWQRVRKAGFSFQVSW